MAHGHAGIFSKISHKFFTSTLLPSFARNRDYYHFHGLPPKMWERWPTFLKVGITFSLLNGLVMYETWYQNYHFNKLSVPSQNEMKYNALPAYQVKYNKDRVMTWNIEVAWDTIKDNVRGV